MFFFIAIMMITLTTMQRKRPPTTMPMMAPVESAASPSSLLPSPFLEASARSAASSFVEIVGSQRIPGGVIQFKPKSRDV